MVEEGGGREKSMEVEKREKRVELNQEGRERITTLQAREGH